ncbi:hypothetical protein M409DRAFT_60137 [Zasmidium cellare ATCC 36951]|uniref:Uncharacterized protein n=1 Tax=Zasmidium cellare ATCC 36951 TaxID=1080233 RepID=A0A6A6C398_ZASCE|nr:uncharacterized protein M409DRAFT_60137 [Zasmidium cellare ATCC 36951]KAF2160219.1 hypothetical protein M409DRAFT_60137 [Zasmidium cellare ATCC 36951]
MHFLTAAGIRYPEQSTTTTPSMTTRCVAEPVFGPPMSPAIFQDKWLLKFGTLYREGPHPNITTNTFIPLEAASHLPNQVTHLEHFDIEAQALQLQNTDFESATPSKFGLTFQKQYGERVGPAFEVSNPFTVAAQVTFWIDYYLAPDEAGTGCLRFPMAGYSSSCSETREGSSGDAGEEGEISRRRLHVRLGAPPKAFRDPAVLISVSIHPRTTSLAGMEGPKGEAVSKPVYGPPMTPTTFRDKWLSKFRMLTYCIADNMSSSTDTDTAFKLCMIAIKQFAHLQCFFEQARGLSLQRSDFPTEPPVQKDDSGRPHIQNEAMMAKLNHFAAASTMALMMDLYLEELQAMKQGRVIRGVRCRDLPLSSRQSDDAGIGRGGVGAWNACWTHQDADVIDIEQVQVVGGPARSNTHDVKSLESRVAPAFLASLHFRLEVARQQTTQPAMAKTDQERAAAKPQYGPIMSPAIFRDKWLSKFRDLHRYSEKHAEARAKGPLILWKCQITHAQMLHVISFYAQAGELSLSRADFPVETPPLVNLKDPDHALRAAVVAKWNPFEAAKRLQYVADVQLYWIRKVKNGEPMRGVPWQALPLVWRQRMNELFQWVAKAEAEGRWSLYDS